VNVELKRCISESLYCPLIFTTFLPFHYSKHLEKKHKKTALINGILNSCTTGFECLLGQVSPVPKQPEGWGLLLQACCFLGM